MAVRIHSQNVRGMSDYNVRRKIFMYFKSKKTNILCLQETFSQPNDEKLWRAEWGSKDVIFSHGQHNSKGVAIFFSHNFDYQIIDSTKDMEGRFIICTIKCQQRYFVLSVVYAPNQDSPEFFVSLFKHLREAPFPEWIILGDFNLALDPKIDRKTYANTPQIKRAALTLKEFMEEHELHDVWRHLHPEKKRYTWHGRVNLASRLDFVLASCSLMSGVTKCEVLSTTFSDHSAILFEVDLSTEKRGPGFWKFNDTLLNDKKYKELIQKKIEETMIKNSKEKLDPLLSWEMIKNEAIGSTLSYSSLKAKERNKNIEELESKINKLEDDLDQCNDPQDMKALYNQLTNAKYDLDMILVEKTAKIIANTKAKWYNEGEASTKYFFNLEKQKYSARCMSKIYLEDGNVITERSRILAEQKRFYEELYTSDPVVQFSLKNQNDERKLTNEERESLEVPLSIQDLTYSLKNMAAGKTPGADGLTSAFYAGFWDILSEPLLCAINYAKRQGRLHISARRGILSLIPKKEKDDGYIKNWRPITLLNTDYKILSKAIANRLQKYLSKLISMDQTGFMKERNISTNIRKIIDIDEYCKNNSIEGIILSVDFEKCFDRVETSGIEKVMEYFNFGPNLIQWVKLLFKDILVCTLNYGYISEHFEVSRGLLQGNPIASYIYLLIAQTLNDKIVENKLIKGIKLGEKEIKSIQFADDLNLPLLFDQQTLTQVLQELKDFKKQVGLSINIAKSCIYRIGTISKSTIILNSQGIPWVNDQLEILGISVTDKDNIETKNVEPLIVKMQTRLNTWKARDLGLIGKVLVLNSLIMSLFVYRFTVLPSISKQIIYRINKIWSNFLWSGKKPKIAWNIICAPKNNGGLGLSDLAKRDISLKCQWVAIYMKDHVVSFLADYFLQNKMGSLIWECNIKSIDCKYITNCRSFWFDVVKSWATINFFVPNGIDQVLDQILWYNSHIKINRRIYIDHEMFKIGIIRIRDILDDSWNFLTTREFQRKYPTINYLSYLTLLHSIPEEWKKCIRSRQNEVVQNMSKIVNVMRGDKIVRIAYKTLHTNVYLLENKWNKWSRILSQDFWPNEFLAIVRRVWTASKNSKLRAFQYKLINHAVITNVHLKMWNLSASDLCSFCGLVSEDYLHLFCTCTKVAELRKYIIELCNNMSPDNNFSHKDFLLNTVNNNQQSIVNTITLVTKYYIYRNRCLEQPLSVNQLKEYILYHNKMEFLGSLVEGRVQKCKDKWEHALVHIKY